MKPFKCQDVKTPSKGLLFQEMVSEPLDLPPCMYKINLTNKQLIALYCITVPY